MADWVRTELNRSLRRANCAGEKRLAEQLRAMLRLSPERYEAEVRMHAQMNMNMIRIWGGAMPERPEFYEACDKYGLLVWQDLWVSGDCNGRWFDPRKKESQERRQAYPDDHSLFLTTAIDQIKMLRNHPRIMPIVNSAVG